MRCRMRPYGFPSGAANEGGKLLTADGLEEAVAVVDALCEFSRTHHDENHAEQYIEIGNDMIWYDL
jgi:hypothetical protein